MPETKPESLGTPPKITDVEVHNLANGIDLSIPVGLGLAAVLYPALLWAFPEPADAFGPDGPRAVPAGPPANTPIVSTNSDEPTAPSVPTPA
jgi:hypothetical protein